MKVKIVNKHNSKTVWYTLMDSLRAIGCYSRDDDYVFDRSRASVVITDGKYILKSRTEYKPKKAPYSNVIYADYFLSLLPAEKKDVIKAVSDTLPPKYVMKDLPEGLTIGSLSENYTITCNQDTLVVKKADVLVQNSIIFKTQTIPFLKKNGVSIIEEGDQFYILDIEKNEATELTPEYLKTKAENDLVNDDISAWTKAAIKFDLINELKMVKKPKDD